MKWILALGLLCSIASCFASGTEQKELGDAREPEIVSSLLPDSQDSTYFLAFPVDDANNNNDQPEEVKAAGSTETETEKPPSAEDNKEEIMTVVVNDDDDKLSKDDIIPIQSIMPKEEQKITIPPPPLPFFLRPKPERPPFPFQSPFERFPFRPKLLPPVRNLLKSFRREESSMKLSPLDIVGAASFLRRMLSTKLRTFAERHQYPIVEEKVSSMPLPLFLPREPLPQPPPPPPPQSIFLPIRAPEFRPFSPLHSLLLPPHPLSFQPSILLPPFALPFSIPPTHFLPPPFYHPLPPFYQPPMPPPFYHALPPPPPFYHHLPPPPPFMQSMPMHDSMTVQNQISPMMQEPQGDSIKMIPSEPKEDENENYVIIPSEEEQHLPFAKSDEYVLLYPNQADFSQNDISIPPPRTRKSLFDFLPPRSNNIRRVIQQTQIFTQFKPEQFLYNQPEQSVYHKPIFRIFDN